MTPCIQGPSSSNSRRLPCHNYRFRLQAFVVRFPFPTSSSRRPAATSLSLFSLAEILGFLHITFVASVRLWFLLLLLCSPLWRLLLCCFCPPLPLPLVLILSFLVTQQKSCSKSQIRLSEAT